MLSRAAPHRSTPQAADTVEPPPALGTRRRKAQQRDTRSRWPGDDRAARQHKQQSAEPGVAGAKSGNGGTGPRLGGREHPVAGRALELKFQMSTRPGRDRRERQQDRMSVLRHNAQGEAPCPRGGPAFVGLLLEGPGGVRNSTWRDPPRWWWWQRLRGGRRSDGLLGGAGGQSERDHGKVHQPHARTDNGSASRMRRASHCGLAASWPSRPSASPLGAMPPYCIRDIM
jgi:hypothetical protein